MENKKTLIFQVVVVVIIVAAALVGAPMVLRMIYAPRTAITAESAYDTLMTARSLELAGSLQAENDAKGLSSGGKQLGTAALTGEQAYVFTCNDDGKMIASLVPLTEGHGYSCLDMNGTSVGNVYLEMTDKSITARITDTADKAQGTVKYTNNGGKFNSSWNVMDNGGKICYMINWTYASVTGNMTYMVSANDRNSINSVQVLAVIELINTQLKTAYAAQE